MRILVDIPNHAELFCRVLDGLIDAGRLEIESGAVDPGPPEDLELVEDEDIAHPGAEEHWQLPSQTARRGGDCKDVSIWRAASLRASGEDPEASVEIWQTGPRDLHCVVLRSDGSTEDVWSQLRDGTWRLGASWLGSPSNPNALPAYARPGGVFTPGGVKAISAPQLQPSAWGVSATAPPPTSYPPGYYPPGGSMYGGIPTAPAAPSYGAYGAGYGGYGGGYGAGYGYGAPPAYEDDDDEDDDEDDDDEDLREQVAELRGELRGQRHSPKDDQGDQGAGDGSST